MATWYVDCENGTDANASVGAGDSFATRRKRLDNLTSAVLAAGDTVRIMASPDPTLVGNGTWTDVPSAATQGTRTVTAATNASPIVITTSVNHGYSTGDTVIINGDTGNTSANGVWKIIVTSATQFSLQNLDASNSTGNGASAGTRTARKINHLLVELASAVTVNVAECGNRNQKANWTQSTNVACTKSTTDWKEGGECQSIAIAAGFTTGKAAFVATGTLNLSSYQQVSFWVKQTAGTLAANCSLRLCSDTAGATPVNTITIPALGALSQWVPVTVNTGGALGSAIQSIALYVDSDQGAQTFLIDNVIACKAASANDSLTLSSLISKNTGTEAWWPIQSINGVRVMLDAAVNTIPGPTPQRGYAGTTETVSTYKRETVKTPQAATSTTPVNNCQKAGTAGNLISHSGGWNRTDMSTQTGETWLDGGNGFGYAIQGNQAFLGFDKIHFTRYNCGIFQLSAGSDTVIGTMRACGCTGSGINMTGVRASAAALSAVSSGGAIIVPSGGNVTLIERADGVTSAPGVSPGQYSSITTITSACNNSSVGVSVSPGSWIGTIAAANDNGTNGYQPANKSTVVSLTANGNGAYAISPGSAIGWRVLGGSSSGNLTACVNGSTSDGSVRNFTIGEATEVANITAFGGGRIALENCTSGLGSGVTVMWTDLGRLQLVTSPVHGTAPASWEFVTTSTNCSTLYPFALPIARVAVGANTQVTATAWFYRTNSAATGRLCIRGGQINGVATDTFSSSMSLTNTWEQLTLTFTPTQAGVVEIEAHCIDPAALYTVRVSDFAVTQA